MAAAGVAHEKLSAARERGVVGVADEEDAVIRAGGDGPAAVDVTYRGVVPDLFREGSGVVAEGRMERGRFVADTILAKHDERYMPPQMGNQTAEHAAAKTLKK